MTQESVPPPTLETPPTFLSASSKKKRLAALVLHECIKLGLPKELRVRAEKAVETFSKNLRYINQPHTPSTLTQAQRDAWRSEKIAGLKALEDCLTASIPNTLKPRVAQSIRDITGNLEYSPGGKGAQVRQEAIEALQGVQFLSPALQRLVGLKVAHLEELQQDDAPPDVVPAPRTPKP